MDGYIRHSSIILKNRTDITVNSPRRVIKNKIDSQKCTVRVVQSELSGALTMIRRGGSQCQPTRNVKRTSTLEPLQLLRYI